MRTTSFLPVLLLVLLVSNAGPRVAGADDGETRRRLGDAWIALEVDRDVERAATAFRALAADPSAPREVRARATLGLARCERLLGKASDGERHLRQVLEEFGDLVAVASEARDGLSRGAEGRSRWFTGIAALGAGQWLDLDTGGVFAGRSTFSGTKAELGAEPDRFAAPQDAADDPEFAKALAPLSPKGWRRTKTDEGRAAWFELLADAPRPFVRFATRVSGTGPLLPAPASMTAASDGFRIRVAFRVEASYARYRVERRTGADGVYATLREIETPSFEDGDVALDVRYGYRVTGITAAGDEGVPGTIQATTKSRGVVAGTAWLDRTPGKNGYDFLLQRGVPESAADIVLTGTYGGRSGASFDDGWGRPVREVDGGGTSVGSPWTARFNTGYPYVEPDRWLVLPLRGGGVARARVSMPEKGAEIRLDYEAYPDADEFPDAPRLVASATGEGIEIRVESPAGTRATEVVAHDVGKSAGEERRLPLRDGKAVDPGASDGRLVEYEASAVDEQGRVGSRGTTFFNTLPAGVREGTFRFHYQQGWSIERDELVPADEADVVFESAAGGISSVTLGAPAGIMSLESVRGRGDLHAGAMTGAALRNFLSSSASRRELFASVVALDPAAVAWTRSVSGDSRLPASDVAVLRTRHGGFAKVAIVARSDSAAGWDKDSTTVLYAFNPKEPVFRPDSTGAVATSGVVLLPLDSLRRERVDAARSAGRTTLRRGTFQFHYRQGWSIEKDALADESTADVVFRSCAGGISSVVLAAPNGIASLEEARRGERGGDVDAWFRAVRAVADAAVRWRETADGDSRTPASDVFVLRTQNGGFAKLAIVKRNETGNWQESPVTIAYVLNETEPVFEEGLGLAAPSPAAGWLLEPALGDTPSPDPTIAASETAAAKKTVALLRSGKIAVSRPDAKLTDVLDQLGGFTVSPQFRLDPAFAPRAAVTHVSLEARGWTLAQILASLAEQAHFVWRVDDDGHVVLADPVPR